MRYHTDPTDIKESRYGIKYHCDHLVYSTCTLFKVRDLGLAVVQQKFNPRTKATKWEAVDPWLCDLVYLHEDFFAYFKKHAKKPDNGLYPTVTIRQVMWALRMKPLKKERWETAFDRKEI